MWVAIKGLMRSKKAVAALCAGVAMLVARLGWKVSADELVLMLSPAIAYILGQSWADHGAQGSQSGNASG